MKKICFAILASLCVSSANAQGGMLLPSTVDSSYNMYQCDTCKCYIIVITNIGFDNWAESEPISWVKAFEWMSEGNQAYPGSFSILYICESAYNTWPERAKWSENIQFVLTGNF